MMRWMENHETLTALLAGAAVFIIWALASATAYATDPAYYNYSTPVTVTLASTASDQTDFLVRVPVNATNMVDSQYIGSDGQDLLVREGATERLAIGELNGNPSSWWVYLPVLEAGQSTTLTMYTGEATTAADNPQRMFLRSASDYVDTPDAAGIDFNTGFTLRLDTMTIDAYPSTNTVIYGKSGAYTLRMNTNGTLTIAVTPSSGSCTLPGGSSYTTTTGVNLGIPFRLEAGARWSNAVGCGFGIRYTRLDTGAVSTDTTGGGACSSCVIANSGNALRLTMASGMNARIQRSQASGSYWVDVTPTYVVDYRYQMLDLIETQEGNAGNSWTWTASVDNDGSGGASNDGTWTHVQDMSSLTVSVGSTQPTTTYAASSTDETFVSFVSDDLTDPFGDSFDTSPTTYGWPLSIFNGLVGDTANYQMPDMLFSSIVFLVTAFLSLVGTYAATRIVGFAIILGAIAASAIVLLTPLPPIMIALIGIVALLSLRIIDEPFTAR